MSLGHESCPHLSCWSLPVFEVSHTLKARQERCENAHHGSGSMTRDRTPLDTPPSFHSGGDPAILLSCLPSLMCMQADSAPGSSLAPAKPSLRSNPIPWAAPLGAPVAHGSTLYPSGQNPLLPWPAGGGGSCTCGLGPSEGQALHVIVNGNDIDSVLRTWPEAMQLSSVFFAPWGRQ